MKLHHSVIAEVGSVHDGSFGNALRLIDACAAAGADVVKFQTHIAAAETLKGAPMPPYFKGEPRFEYFTRTGFTDAQWRELAAHCRQAGVGFLSSPFSIEAVELLERVGADAFKIPSGEVTNLPMLERIAATGKPVLLSSGMSNWAELDAAVEALKRGGPLLVMQCATAYPCPPEQVGLNVLAEMAGRYGVPIGYSDHFNGPAASLAAAAHGAVAIEKHFTFSRAMYGSDAANATEPGEFRDLVQWLRQIWAMREHPVDKDDIAPYAEMKRIFQKSVVTARAVPAGKAIEAADLAYKKPGDGIPAARWREVIGRKARRAMGPDHKLAPEDLT
jgi:N,N'-diacetyllegionaminate synthase